jgi:hypothetical protein
MFNWCRLVKVVLDAEFPDFELLAKFSIFRIVGAKQMGSASDVESEDDAG